MRTLCAVTLVFGVAIAFSGEAAADTFTGNIFNDIAYSQNSNSQPSISTGSFFSMGAFFQTVGSYTTATHFPRLGLCNRWRSAAQTSILARPS
jgi:hypothetical protein